jgi:hypothetical protein
MPGPSPVVVAQVLLRSATGAYPGVDVPIRADTVEQCRPAPGDALRVAGYFRESGFDVSIPHEQTVTVVGSAEGFERCFNVRLAYEPSGSYSVRTASGRRRTDATKFPLGSLPVALRKLVAAVSVDTGAEFTESTSIGVDL